MSNNRETNLRLIDLPEDVYTKAMPAAGISNNEMIKISKDLSLTCRNFYSMFEEPMTFFALKKLLHAVVDDDQKTVKKILNCKLEILLITPPPKWIITSQLTGDEYSAKDALMMACQLRQTNMIKLLISYYNKMTQIEIVINKKTKALASWPLYQIEKNRKGEHEIVIPQEYISYIHSLINIFLNETFEDGCLSLATRQSILALTQKLQSKQETHLDKELFLLAAYKEFTYMWFNTYNDDMKRNVVYFCTQAMSKIQAAVLPDNAKILCFGLTNAYHAISNHAEIQLSQRAENYFMQYGVSLPYKFFDKIYDSSFYHCSSSNDRGILGEDFFCGITGEATVDIHQLHFAYNMFHHYLKHKQQVFFNLCMEATKTPDQINFLVYKY